MNKWYIGSMAMLVGAASYGISGPFAKLAYLDGLTVGELVTSLFFVSSALFSLIFLFNPHRLEGLTRKNVWQLACLGGTGLGATVTLYYIAIHELPVSVAIVLLFQFAWIVPLLHMVLNRKWPNIYMICSLVLVLLGTVMAVQLQWGFWREGTLFGYVAGFISAWCYAVYLYYNGVVATNVSALTRSAIMSIGGLIVVLIVHPPIYLFNGRWIELGAWPVISGVLNQVFPTLLMAIGIPIIGGVLSGIMGAIELPVSVLSSNIILNEPISLLKWAGIILILVGIALATSLGDRKVRKIGIESKSAEPINGRLE